MPLVRYKPASRSISARPRRPTTAPDSPLINRVHHKSSPANRCVPRTLTYNGLSRPYDVMVGVIASLGLRAEEMVALQWTDFDFEKKKELFIKRAYTHRSAER